MKIVWYLLIALLLVMPGTALGSGDEPASHPGAAPPESPPEQPPSPGREQQEQDQGYLKVLKSETTIEGKVTDATGQPLEGVTVTLFVGGRARQSTTTDVMGSYKISYLLDYGKDESVVLWYVPPMKPWLPKAVVLKESSSAVRNRLFGPCIPKIELKTAMQFDVSIVDAKTRTMQIKQSGCLED